MSIEYPCVHWNKGKCKKFSNDKVTSWCVEGPCKEQTPSNADRIRAMSDEELAKFVNLCGHDFPPYCDVENSISGECDQNCIKCAEEWLKQSAE